MEAARSFLKVAENKSELVSGLTFPAHRPQVDSSFYEYFALRGIRVDRVEPGFISCTFVVPARLTDRNGKFASGAVANLVDIMGSAVAYENGRPMNLSVDISISYLSTAKLGDELDVSSEFLGRNGGYSGTLILVKNKFTGELIVEGRHSLFGKIANKL